MSIELLITALSLLLGFIAILYLLNKKLSQKPKTDEALFEWLKSMQTSIEQTNKSINEVLRTSSNDMVKTLQENSKQLNERLDKAATVIRDVGKEVGQMSEIGRSMRELQEFLKSPKLRGNIGEQVLKDLISQMFPKNSFFLQHQFKSGEKVDAAIKTDAGILPIDSKFPMENFQKMVKAQTTEEKENAKKEFTRDVKKHIDAISKKYILPEEGTMDFALMYVPSESVYYELVGITEMIDYARKARVYIVSPNTLYIHLQTILLSFEGKKVESQTREVFRMLRALQIDYEKVEENLNLLGKHLNNASSQFSNVNGGFLHLGQKIKSTQNLNIEETKKTLHKTS
ncbi:DNA recombination protein RmuC [Candidatus Microgenomates bacterium]|nr:MAG: DNA recombination protein RmuC [Candidatus Microgenomates bacterium]